MLNVASETDGVLVQVISNDSLEYAGLQQEQIQQILERRMSDVKILVNQESSMDEIKGLKVATTKIRKRIEGTNLRSWDGWIPSRRVKIEKIEGIEILDKILPEASISVGGFAKFEGINVEFNGPEFNMISVVAGVKGSGKSHLAKHLVLALASKKVPCIIFDPNGEYIKLNNPQVLKWGANYKPDLAETGPQMLEELVRSLYPLQSGTPSEAIFSARLPTLFAERKRACSAGQQEYTIDVPYLHKQAWGGGDLVETAIRNRLELISRLNIFALAGERHEMTLKSAYEIATAGCPIVFDMRRVRSSLAIGLVKSTLDAINRICDDENSSLRRFPFVFFEEAHLYISEPTILDIITRGRHIGVASVFVTNTPQKLPDMVFRQLDNLFLLSLTHRDDIRSVSQNSYADEETVRSFATRMPERHAMIVGNVTARYPLVVEIGPMPEGIEVSGKTRSTWDRLSGEAGSNENDSPSIE